MKWFRRKKDPVVQYVTVVVDEADVEEFLSKIDFEFKRLETKRASITALVRELERLIADIPKLQSLIAESRTEQRKLENSIASARRKGRSWG